jgi:DNA invertase Pin-like site-specific DNA recombinase
MNPVDELRALVMGRGVLEARIAEVATDALKSGVDRTSVAFALGISRASLYRRFRDLVGRDET